MPLGTLATRYAKANARSFCCRNNTLSLLTSFKQISYELYRIAWTVRKKHHNWE